MASYVFICRSLTLISRSLPRSLATIHENICHERFCTLSRHIHLSASTLFARRWTIMNPAVTRQRRKGQFLSGEENVDKTSDDSLDKHQVEASHGTTNTNVFDDQHGMHVHSNSRIIHSHSRKSNITNYKANDAVRNTHQDLEQQQDSNVNEYIFDDLRQVHRNAHMSRITQSRMNESSIESQSSAHLDRPRGSQTFNKTVRHHYDGIGANVSESPAYGQAHGNTFYRPADKKRINEGRNSAHDQKESRPTRMAHSQHRSQPEERILSRKHPWPHSEPGVHRNTMIHHQYHPEGDGYRQSRIHHQYRPEGDEYRRSRIHHQYRPEVDEYRQSRIHHQYRPKGDEDRQSRIHPRHRFETEEHRAAQIRLTGEGLFGVHPVKLALQIRKRQMYTLYLHEKEGVSMISREFEEMAVLKDVKYEYCSKRVLDVMSEGRPHQGVCLDCSPLSMSPYSMDDAEKQARLISTENRDVPPLWLFLYHVKDPMNFGAILRTSYFLGVDRILTGRHNSCPLSPVVSKASSGAMELLDVFNTHGHLSELLQVHKSNGWSVLGTDTGVSSANQYDEKLISVHECQLERPTLLVIGSEGTGLPPWLLRECDQLLTVRPFINQDTQSLSSAVTSLNVSVATGIILHSLTYTNKMKMDR